MFAGIFITLAAALAHSISFITRKKGLQRLNYKSFILLRNLLGTILGGLLLWTVGSGLSGVNIKVYLIFITTGIFGGGLMSLITTTMAIHEIGASKTHALTSASPLVTAIFEIVFLGELITLKLGIGTVIIVLGAFFLSLLLYGSPQSNLKGDKTNSRPLLGLGLALYTTVAIGIHMVLQKIGLQQGATPLQGLFIQSTSAFIPYYLYLRFTNRSISFSDMKGSSYFFIASLSMTAVPLLTLYALTYLSATMIAALMRIAPLFTVILTFLFLKGIEEINWKISCSALLIVIGAVLVSLN